MAVTNNAINAPIPFGPIQGGTGNDNGINGSITTNNNVIDFGGPFSTASTSNIAFFGTGFDIFLTFTANTAVTFPTSGTLATTTDLGAFPWTVETTPITLVADNGYFASTGAVTFTLPATANVGDTFVVSAIDTGSFQVAQNAGQTIQVGNAATTTGVTGSVTSTAVGDLIEFVCSVANNNFTATGIVGNLTVA